MWNVFIILINKLSSFNNEGNEKWGQGKFKIFKLLNSLIICFILFSIVYIFKITTVSHISSSTTSFTPIQEINLDFEQNLVGWEVISEHSGSDFQLDTTVKYEGDSSGRLNGTTRYRYNFTKNLGQYVPFTSNTSLSFTWRFENTLVDYIGFILFTPLGQPDIYVTSYFGGDIYLNNSNYLVIQYRNEATFTWYVHTLNLTQAYMQYYGYTPDSILALDVLNFYDTNPTGQITNFDSLLISNLLTITPPTSTEPSTTSPSLITSLLLEPFGFVILILFLFRRRRTKGKQKSN